MTEFFCGIDPGINGAMAFYCVEPIEMLFVYDFVTIVGGHTVNKYGPQVKKRTINISATADVIRSHEEKYGKTKLVLLETPNSLPNDGHVGAFNFGKACGIIEGILGTLNLKVIPTFPAVWKTAMNLSSNKQKSLDKAKEVFKDIDGAQDYFLRVRDNDRAEAALIAWHCARKFGGIR